MCSCGNNELLFIVLIMLNTLTAVMRHFQEHRSLAVWSQTPAVSCRDGCMCVNQPTYSAPAISCHQAPLNGVTHLISMTTAGTWMSPALQPMMKCNPGEWAVFISRGHVFSDGRVLVWTLGSTRLVFICWVKVLMREVSEVNYSRLTWKEGVQALVSFWPVDHHFSSLIRNVLFLKLMLIWHVFSTYICQIKYMYA